MGLLLATSPSHGLFQDPKFLTSYSHGRKSNYRINTLLQKHPRPNFMRIYDSLVIIMLFKMSKIIELAI